MHEMAHILRGNVADAEKSRQEQRKSEQKEATARSFRMTCENLCNHIRDYFRTLVKDQTVECCIRLADQDSDDPNDPKVSYCTAGRSSGLSAARDKTSEPIPANVGLPRFFLAEKDCQGVFLIHDLETAIADGVFKKTRNEGLYPSEIKTLMVAPINGWSGKDCRMVGLLFVGSRVDRFRAKHVDSVRTVADMLGLGLTRMVNILFDKRTRRFPEEQGA